MIFHHHPTSLKLRREISSSHKPVNRFQCPPPSISASFHWELAKEGTEKPYYLASVCKFLWKILKLHEAQCPLVKKKVNCFNFCIHTLAHFFSSATLFHVLIALFNYTFKAGGMEMQISVGNGYISLSFLKQCTFEWYCIYSPNCKSHPQGVDLYNCEEFCITAPSLPIHYDKSKEWSQTRLHLIYFSLFLGWSMCPHLECWCEVTWQP